MGYLWLMWLGGVVGGWALRGLWINYHHVRPLLRESQKIITAIAPTQGDIDQARKIIEKARAILGAL